jgi:class 3 adenylate cyclase/predicted ATPase
VLFCDLVGSTALSEQLDPEELREVVRAYQETCTTVIQRYDGHIAQHLGDGLLVYFGYPVAHEDDAQRAVRAGIEIIDALRESSLQNKQLPNPLQVRIGIHTGLVVIGEIGSSEKREMLALGETPNIAARLQGLAEPDTVVLSAATQRLVAGLFACEDLGQQTLKGISTPLSVYRVVGESAAQSRFEVAVGTGLTPLVGREEELGLLQRRWAQAQEGTGQVVLLSGEPGIGKSRLVQALKDQLGQGGATRIEFRCSPYHQNSALYPIIDLLQRVLGFSREDSPQEKLRKLKVGAHGQWKSQAEAVLLQPDLMPLLAALLSLPHPDGYPPLNLTPQRQKQKTQEALVAWIVEEAGKASVYCAWEDLHWADPSTLEVLTLLLTQVPTTRLLAVLTFRPDFTPPWGARSYLTPLTLSRLERPHVETMVEKVTGGKTLPAEVVHQIVSKTDGVPLFVEELSKMVVESGLVREADGHYELTGSLPLLAIPSTLHDSLMARLDRLATVKEVAQWGATLGREFSYEFIQAVAPGDEGSLQQALAKLVEAEVLYQRGVPPQARYVFKHALIQDAAYQSLLKSRRQQYHQQIAHILAERFIEIAETQPELVAHHYTEAGLGGQAIPYWQRAGQRAIERSAHVEAISHLTKGLEVLKTLPDTSEHAQHELTLQVALGTALFATKGYGAPEVEKTYARARELCQQVGKTPQLFPILRGLWAFYLVRAEYETAYKLGEQFLTLAQNVHDAGLLVEAHFLVGFTSNFLGDFASARTYSEQGIALYDSRQHRSLAFFFGVDPGVNCLSCTLLVLWCLGYPEQALKRSREALTLAQEFAHPFSLGWALVAATWFQQYCREEKAAQEHAEAVIALSIEQGFPFWLACGTILRGWALAKHGQGEEGIARMRQGLDAMQATGAEFARSYFLALLAEVYGKVGQPEEGLTTLAEALAAVDKTREHFYEAELHRLKGQLTLQKFQVSSSRFQVTNPQPPIPSTQAEAETEACFHKAIEIARRQQAKSLELRAATSLSRLWQQQGKKAEARQMLAEIYGWFTEGFDTKDLQEARALLEELS